MPRRFWQNRSFRYYGPRHIQPNFCIVMSRQLLPKKGGRYLAFFTNFFSWFNWKIVSLNVKYSERFVYLFLCRYFKVTDGIYPRRMSEHGTFQIVWRAQLEISLQRLEATIRNIYIRAGRGNSVLFKRVFSSFIAYPLILHPF